MAAIESAAMNGTSFQDPIGFIKFSISPEFVPLLMDKDLLHMIFVSSREIKQELYSKSFQVNDLRENLPPGDSMLRTLLVQLLSTKIVHFYDKSMKLCQITTNPKTNISGYGAKPNSTLDISTAQALKWPT